jgi:hypothetical protein
MISRLCRCGHRWPAHDHHRPGTECVICGGLGCLRFRWRWSPWARTLALAVIAAVAVALLLGGCGGVGCLP